MSCDTWVVKQQKQNTQSCGQILLKVFAWKYGKVLESKNVVNIVFYTW